MEPADLLCGFLVAGDCPKRRKVSSVLRYLTCSRRGKVVKCSLSTDHATSEYFLNSASNLCLSSSDRIWSLSWSAAFVSAMPLATWIFHDQPFLGFSARWCEECSGNYRGRSAILVSACVVTVRANLHFFTLDVHRKWFILSECERWKLEYLYLSMVQFVSLVFKMPATEIVSVGIELISLTLTEECRKILEKRKKRRPRRWWVKPGPAFGWGERGPCPGRWLRGGAEKAVTDRPHVNT
jgi:hypothetical protein